ncbi:MAG: lipocalin family protein [Desulfobulbales bacterium]|nr:lipocalin family protein [Desulfobulbales bacterium]
MKPDGSARNLEIIAGYYGAQNSPVETVNYVDLTQYTGVWFEVARHNNRFQKNYAASKATYKLRSDGKIIVLNECHDKSFSGKIRSATGKALVVEHSTNAKLKVSFFWPFAGDYWIIDLGQDYDYVASGYPKRKYLWILRRS